MMRRHVVTCNFIPLSRHFSLFISLDMAGRLRIIYIRMKFEIGVGSWKRSSPISLATYLLFFRSRDRSCCPDINESKQQRTVKLAAREISHVHGIRRDELEVHASLCRVVAPSCYVVEVTRPSRPQKK